MVIQLKRFKKEYLSNGYATFIKMTHLIEFPFLLNLDFVKIGKEKEMKTNYELYGVINHYGSYGAGHYTAYCKNFLEDEWYHYDDTNVEAIKKN